MPRSIKEVLSRPEAAPTFLGNQKVGAASVRRMRGQIIWVIRPWNLTEHVAVLTESATKFQARRPNYREPLDPDCRNERS